jgi:2-polyprenyl-6-methoxyphenol hydroxylase-like FAD-dependent oxidoreductase
VPTHWCVRRWVPVFPGGTYQQIFYVADVEASGPPLDGELHVDLDEADFLAIFPLAGEGRARLIGTVRDERVEHPEALEFGDVSGRAIDHLKVRVGKVNWFSTYRVHHRVTEHFRKGRAFLLGDAAHIHTLHRARRKIRLTRCVAALFCRSRSSALSISALQRGSL